jgi:hypothetical protein
MVNNEGKYLCNNLNNKHSSHSFLHSHDKNNQQRTFLYKELPTMQAFDNPILTIPKLNHNFNQKGMYIYIVINNTRILIEKKRNIIHQIIP